MMPMMNVGSMVMGMLDFFVLMFVIMPAKIRAVRHTVWVRMMVIVMSVPMRVPHLLMPMRMYMFFTIKYPERSDHQSDGDPMDHRG